METIDLDLDNENEMVFKVQIEGTRPGEPLCRLMIESEDMSHYVQGEFGSNDEVTVVLPPMDKVLKEGSYESYLEVLVDDRVFIPLEMKLNFEKTVSVVAESVSRRKKKPSASASLINSTRRTKPGKTSRSKVVKKVQTPDVEKLSESDILRLVSALKSKVR
jgi:hypothetical protein